jgi:hypothetical protein
LSELSSVTNIDTPHLTAGNFFATLIEPVGYCSIKRYITARPKRDTTPFHPRNCPAFRARRVGSMSSGFVKWRLPLSCNLMLYDRAVTLAFYHSKARPQVGRRHAKRFCQANHGTALRAALALKHVGNRRLADAEFLGNLNLSHSFSFHNVP